MDHPPTSAYYRFIVGKGSYFSEVMQFDDPDNTSWTLSGMTFRMEIKRSYEDDTPLIILQSADDKITIVDAVQRIIKFAVSNTDLQGALKVGTYFYDLIMIDAGGTRTEMMHGEFVFANSITGG